MLAEAPVQSSMLLNIDSEGSGGMLGMLNICCKSAPVQADVRRHGGVVWSACAFALRLHFHCELARSFQKHARATSRTISVGNMHSALVRASVREKSLYLRHN